MNVGGCQARFNTSNLFIVFLIYHNQTGYSTNTTNGELFQGGGGRISSLR